MKRPLVSIIMPAYNVDKYISTAIMSVQCQTYQNWELIIVDDCSTDTTVSIVEDFIVDKRIKLVVNACNKGAAGSRNVALELANGRYIAFLDSDDLWHSEKLELQISFMQKNNFYFTFTSYSSIDESGKKTSLVNAPKKIKMSSLLMHNPIGCLTVIYDAEMIGKVKMPIVKKRNDFALWIEILKRVSFGYGLNEELAYYKVRHGSLSSSNNGAFKYYWKVIREVGGLSLINASFCVLTHFSLAFLKRKAYKVYNKFAGFLYGA